MFLADAINWAGAFDWSAAWAVLTLRDYNTRVVALGAACLGLASGVVGTFVLLRKRSLLGDALSHATLPGIAAAFLLMSAAGATGKSLPGLLLGATLSGVLGVVCVLLIVHHTRIKQDAAIGIVLGVFFGVGMALMGIIQNAGTGHAAGLSSFIYGRAASMLAGEALLIAIGSSAAALACALLFKELTLLCFDPGFGGAQGWPIVLLDSLLMALVVGVTVIGLQAVGLIMMVALLVIPPAAARFWTERLWAMVLISGGCGALSGLLGAMLSALTPRLPSGAVIVLVASGLFGLSMLLGGARGIVARAVGGWRVARRIARQHLLRAVYEFTEGAAGAPRAARGAPRVPVAALLPLRSWSDFHLRRELERARRDGLVRRAAAGAYELTGAGVVEARRVTRNHRLWELFLIRHADIAPSHVDRDADEVEHVLSQEMIAELEGELTADHPELAAPPSPHRLPAEGGGA
ncbi:MAG: metal ABC transporter permease [Phycisphaerae bacterium]|nr:metal ABC transporter permease [Phycisphaerae bacterium]MCZ2399333.1 metal ABC transporter permease [Phycisphaerae bacterium]